MIEGEIRGDDRMIHNNSARSEIVTEEISRDLERSQANSSRCDVSLNKKVVKRKVEA